VVRSAERRVAPAAVPGPEAEAERARADLPDRARPREPHGAGGDWQGRGVGSRLAARLVRAARENGITHLTALTLWENRAAMSLVERLGFLRVGYDGDTIEYELAL
jgi:hypothetical protein